ncbi:MAG: transglycosylase SLT domain-containing protein [Roseobacter sp.]
MFTLNSAAFCVLIPMLVLFAPLSAAQEAQLPSMRWAHMDNHMKWNRAADEALKEHGLPLALSTPEDITQWCPHYPNATMAERRQFWVGFMSALAKHESTYRPTAVGGSGRWFGLVQISPATARGYGCRARTGEALKNGSNNMSCAVRIMAVTVPRDGVIHARDSKWRGVSADWGPMRSPAKRADMSEWLKKQSFCKPQVAPKASARPRLRRSSADR